MSTNPIANTYIIIVGVNNKRLYYTTSAQQLSAITLSYSCCNSGVVAINLGTYGFTLICGGNDGDKSAPFNNIYVLIYNNVTSSSLYANTPPVDAHCGNNITCSAAITIVNGNTTTQQAIWTGMYKGTEVYNYISATELVVTS